MPEILKLYKRIGFEHILASMRTIATLSLAIAGCFGLGACTTTTNLGDSPSAKVPSPAGVQGLVLNNLMSADLEGVEGTKVIVSHVTIPPNTSLPKHWHPGEEFAYVLDGKATLWQKGKRNIVCEKGDVVRVPLKQIHTAITGDEGVVLLVFRVFEKGQPERFLVED